LYSVVSIQSLQLFESSELYATDHTSVIKVNRIKKSNILCRWNLNIFVGIGVLYFEVLAVVDCAALML